MVFRTLIRLSGGQPGPTATYMMPYMRRADRKGHREYQILLWSNIFGGVGCILFMLRYLTVRDRGLCVHFERAETGNDPKGTPLQLYVAGTRPYTIPNRPDIGVYQPIIECTSVPTDHGEEGEH